MPTTLTLPLTYALTIGTSSTQVLPGNPARKGVVFFNPGPNSIAVCPSTNNTGATVPAVINGAGSITILPGGMLTVPPVPWIDGVVTCAWNAIGGGAASPFTAWEF
jgi:hypothetical protein